MDSRYTPGVDWSVYRDYQTLDNRVVVVDPALPVPDAVRSDLQVRLDAMGPDDGRPEMVDGNGITPSNDLRYRLGHIGKQLITVRLRATATAGVFTWHAVAGFGLTTVSGTDRNAVLRDVETWVASQKDPNAWVVVAATGPVSAPTG
ncbi:MULTISPECIES: hypothetical protein [unclassified Microbacterium]|uniref:hypothetical protein n=1 Tax=unclassified Microbacterium TaxID=2609290 RepID=UPI00214C5CED|nr:MULTISPECIES: hypothetical protein [unclassified Microbacterium]MCR2785171.1 hypothetical protein [Microbacterium sp. zg.B96]MDL5352533.1 hypothetical protein [Microbacterium sp. zg-YB36]WIM16704.1 hypothetical protein QNO11_03415 [Microbacterium sp. zg-B96]